MSSNFDNFVRTLTGFYGMLCDHLDTIAWVALGGLLLAGLCGCAWIGRWVMRGGLTRPSRQLFAEHRKIEHYLRKR